MRPTPRVAILLAAAAPLALIAGSAAPALWTLPFDATVVLFAAFALDALMTMRRQAVRVSITVAPRIFIGDPATVAVRIEISQAGANWRGAARTLELTLAASGDLDPPGITQIDLTQTGSRIVDMAMRPRRRGRIEISAVELRWRGPLRLNQRLLSVPVDVHIDVVPNIRAAQTAALHFYDRDAPFGVKMQRDRGAGTEFDSLREFMPGMDIGGIDWKHSARHGRLVGKEFRVERNHSIVLAFDTGHLMQEPIDGVPRLDHAIGVGLLLGWMALRGGDLVGTYGFDARVRHWSPPLRGTGNFTRLQQQAATLSYHTEETNFTLALAELAQRLKRRTLVVLFTDFVDTVTAELMVESMQHLGSRHLVIFVSLRDPVLQQMVDAIPDHAGALARAVVANDFLRERSTVFARLARMGVHCLDVDRQAVSVALINKYVAIKQRGLL